MPESLALFYHWLTVGFGKSRTNLDLSFAACEMELTGLISLKGCVGVSPSTRMGSWLGMWSMVSEAGDHRLPHLVLG